MPGLSSLPIATTTDRGIVCPISDLAPAATAAAAVVAAGVIGPLAALLEDGTRDAKEHAARALAILSRNGILASIHVLANLASPGVP